MKVYVKVEGRKFFIPIPLCLANLGISIMQSPFIQRHIPEKDRKYMDLIDYKSLKKSINELRNYKGLKLVEVKAKDGTEVTITI